MFAVIKTGGKQYRVQEGDVLQVEKLGAENGQKVFFDQVLLIDDGGKTLIGTPFLENARVRAEVIEDFKDKKILVFKKKRRKQYKKKRGHRQELTRLRIDEIIPDLRAVPKKEVTKIEKKVEKRAAPKEKPKPEKIEPKEIEKERPKRAKEKKAAKKEPEEKREPSKKRALAKAAAKPKKQTKAKE
jgi:large subunit ribosomal protein L21